MLMLMHEGCGTIKCGSTTCRNYNGTCDGGRILDASVQSFHQQNFFFCIVVITDGLNTA